MPVLHGDLPSLHLGADDCSVPTPSGSVKAAEIGWPTCLPNRVGECPPFGARNNRLPAHLIASATDLGAERDEALRSGTREGSGGLLQPLRRGRAAGGGRGRRRAWRRRRRGPSR